MKYGSLLRASGLASIVLLSVVAGAQERAPERTEPTACTALAEPWRAARSIRSARDLAEPMEAEFAVAEPVRFVLHPDGEVAYLSLPRGEGDAASFGGLASFTVAHAGTYRVGLSEPVWVDVVDRGKPAESLRFGPGPECSGIRKAVSFALRPGAYVLEISGGAVAEVGVLVERLP